MLLTVLFGCGGTSSSFSFLTPTRQFDGLQFTLSADNAVYAKGTNVAFNLTVRNTGTRAVTLYNAGCFTADAEITQAGTHIWQKSEGVSCTANVTNTTLAAGETRTFAFTWNQQNHQQAAVTSGTYQIKAWVTGYLNADGQNGSTNTPTDLASNPLTITVAP